MSFDNGKWWPMAYRPRETWTHAYRTLEEAGIGPLDGDDRSKDWQDWLALGIGIGLLIGLGLVDMMETFA